MTLAQCRFTKLPSNLPTPSLTFIFLFFSFFCFQLLWCFYSYFYSLFSYSLSFFFWSFNLLSTTMWELFKHIKDKKTQVQKIAKVKNFNWTCSTWITGPKNEVISIENLCSMVQYTTSTLNGSKGTQAVLSHFSDSLARKRGCIVCNHSTWAIEYFFHWNYSSNRASLRPTKHIFILTAEIFQHFIKLSSML